MLFNRSTPDRKHKPSTHLPAPRPLPNTSPIRHFHSHISFGESSPLTQEKKHDESRIREELRESQTLLAERSKKEIHEQTVIQLTSQYELKELKLRKNFETTILELKQQHQKEIDDLTIRFERHIQDIQANREQLIQAHELEISKLALKAKEYNDTKEQRLKESLRRRLQDFEFQFEQTKQREFDKILYDEKQKINKSWEEKLEEVKYNLKDRYDRESRNVSTEMEKWKSEYQLQIEKEKRQFQTDLIQKNSHEIEQIKLQLLNEYNHKIESFEMKYEIKDKENEFHQKQLQNNYLMKLQEESQLKISQLKLEFEAKKGEEIERLQKTYEEKIQHLKQLYEIQTESKMNANQSIQDKLQHDLLHSNKSHTQEMEYKLTIKELEGKLKYETDIQQKLHIQLQQVNSDWSLKLSELQQQCKVDIQQVNNQWSLKVSDHQQQHQVEIQNQKSELSKEFEGKYKEWQSKLDQQTERMKQLGIELEHKQEIHDNKGNKLKLKYESKLNEMKEIHLKHISDLESKFMTEKSQLQLELQELRGKEENYETQVVQLKLRLEQYMKDTTHGLRQAIEDLKTENTNLRIQQAVKEREGLSSTQGLLRSEERRQTVNTKSKATGDDELERKISSKVKAVETTWRQKVDDLMVGHKKELIELSDRHRRETDELQHSLQDRYDSDVEHIKTEFHEQFLRLKLKMETSHEHNLQELQREYQGKLAGMEAEVKTERERSAMLNIAVEDRISRLQKSMEEINREETRKLVLQHRAQLAAIRREWEGKFESLKDTHKNELHQLREDMERSSKEEWQSKEKDVERDYMKRIRELENQVKMQLEHENDLQLQYEQKLVDLQERHLVIMERETREIEEKMKKALEDRLIQHESSLELKLECQRRQRQLESTGKSEEEIKKTSEKRVAEIRSAWERKYQSLQDKYDASFLNFQEQLTRTLSQQEQELKTKYENIIIGFEAQVRSLQNIQFLTIQEKDKDIEYYKNEIRTRHENENSLLVQILDRDKTITELTSKLANDDGTK